MGDFNPVSPGDELRIGASAWNAAQEAGRAWERRKFGRGGAPMLENPLGPACRILIRNDTGVAAPPGSVLKLLEGLVVSYPDAEPRDSALTPCLVGSTPDAATNPFAITFDPLEDSEIGRAVVVGIAVADVDYTNVLHRFAVPKTGETAYLTSAANGSARILYRSGAGTGVQKCLLLLSGAAARYSPWKDAARAATTANGALSSFVAGATVDGVTLAAGDRLLIKSQTTATENGIYVVQSAASPTRADDCAAGADFIGATLFVSEGTLNGNTIWECTNDAVTVGVTNVTWDLPYAANKLLGGIVSTSAQDFVGKKTFNGHPTNSNPPRIVLDPNSTAATLTVARDDATTKAVITGAVSTGGGGEAATLEVSPAGPGGTGSICLVTQQGGGPVIRGVSPAITSTIWLHELDYFGTGPGTEVTVWDFSTGGGGAGVYANSVYTLGVTTTVGYGYYVQDGAGTTYTGQNASVLGMTFTCGLLTAVGATGLTIPQMADGTAANSTLYDSTTNGKLSWKDAGGTVWPLY